MNSIAQPTPVTLLVLSGPGETTGQQRQLTATEIHVGRQDSSRTEQVAGWSLDDDSRVSRSHARLYTDGQRWWIEDLGSRAGTTVEGQPISEGPAPVEPGATIATGRTVWTFLPADWILVRHKDVTVAVHLAATLNYARHHCGMPLVRTLCARNVGALQSAAMTLDLRLEPYAQPCQVEVPSLEPDAKAVLPPPAIRLHVEMLKRQVEAARASLRVSLEQTHETRELAVLGFWDWACDLASCETIATFVSPRNSVIERIVWDAQAELKELARVDTFERLLRSGTDDAEQLAMRAIYRCLARHRNLQYVAPRLTRSDTPGASYQTVRPPHRIFLPDPTCSDGEATCVDLAVLTAGCLERVGLYPLVIFTGDQSNVPSHAFVGCWIGSTPGGYVVVRDLEVLQREVALGNLLVLECTGSTAGVPGRADRLDFQQAQQSAARQLDTASWCCAVDVGAARPPYGAILPMDSPTEPEVETVLEQSRQFAKRKRRRMLETSHLLFGLVAAGGDAMRWLLAEAGIEAEAVCEKLETLVRGQDAREEPVATQSYLDCRQLAERCAHHAGAPSVREQDLIWAVLHKATTNARLRPIFHQCGMDPQHFSTVFRRRYPCPETLFLVSESLDAQLGE